MYEDQTYQVILNRMLARVTTEAQNRGMAIDIRELSLIRTALSPTAVELEQAYIALDQVLNESFADTESRDFLIRRAAERAVIVEPATKAIRLGIFNIAVPMGARLSLGKLNYVVVAAVDGQTTQFQLQCETTGYIGNTEFGNLVPIEYIPGLTSAVLADVLIPGEDAEDTEALRQRYYNSLNALAFGGNIQDYAEKVLALDGIGGVKVYPVWDGGGTVKLVIITTQFAPPSATLIDTVQTAIDPIPNQGQGLGIAPIGHTVTVAGVTATTVNVTTVLTFDSGWDWTAIQPYVEQAVDDYFAELAAGWDKVNWRVSSDVQPGTLIVRIAQLETRFLALTGVIDVTGTALNGVAANLTLDKDAIPIRGTVTSG